MLSINILRSNPERVKENLKKRGQEEKVKWVDEIVKLDKRWKILKQKADSLRNQRNKLTEEVRVLKEEKKEASPKIKQAKEIPQKIKNVENEMGELYENIISYLQRIPNILAEDVPGGEGESKNVPFKFWGKKPEHKFELKPHGEFLEEMGLAEFETGATVAGAGFYYLKGDLALLDIALQKYGIDLLLKKGFSLVSPPIALNKRTISGAVNFEDFRDVLYKIDQEDLYLVPTAEHPLIGMFQNKTFRKEDLPIKVCAITPCFRKEIGSHGVDTRGLFRVHQFYKVEQVIISNQEESYDYLEEMQGITEEFFKSLKIPFRVVNICAGDLGPKMAKQYDIEAWFPRQNSYQEVTSAGNTTEYQATKLNVKYLEGDEKKYTHMLNNTMVATSRAMVAIVENFQKKDGTISIPKPLRKYMLGKKKIGGYPKNGRR